ncbi:hypothetical protein B0J11DRAFT_79697 [Dendryphion nanum]|uniref:Transcription factor TFIIIC triple barrel domain-containing protein n=1 Tax=Dendryphion nanum TaxID=256645 RepID=A0A9P9DE70_9PLEO|nr:hypothetical protein B0J11DRAFT_79697 [Dendryphion nanum]
MAAADEEEWEYEYDNTETEDFYVTLDISNVPEKYDKTLPAKPAQPAIGNPTLLQSRLRRLGNTRGGENAVEVLDAPGSEPFSKMQIINLHTSNPLVMYNDQLLSCTWASSIGTDLFFVKPSSDEENDAVPLRSLPSVDLLALGSTRLLATGARLQPREEAYHKPKDIHANASIDAAELSKTTARTTGETQEEPDGSEETRKPPTGFLARLNEAKAKRGDKTTLLIASTSGGTRLVSEQKATERTDRIAPSSAVDDAIMEDAG